MPIPHNLPAPTTPFFGRSEELFELAALLGEAECRLLTLTGPGGIGKTRLALQTAQELVGSDHPAVQDGAFFVALAPLNNANSLIAAVAAAVGYAFSDREEPDVQLYRYMAAKRLLLVLDNFEHLLPDGADFVAALLAAAPQVRVLATSREPLNLQEEWLRAITGLHFPPAADLAPAGDVPTPYSAIMFFNACARRVSGQFSLLAEYPHVARICRIVEGMPLGIELAAAWLKVMPPAEIAAEIQRGLDILTTRARNVPARHRSIRVVFEASWQRLTPPEQAALARLSLLRGGFNRAAAQAVAGASLPLLAALVDHSLLHHHADGRYTIHELLRQFAGEQLHTDPAAEQTAYADLIAYYTALLRHLLPDLRGAGQIAALDTVEAEIDNIRTAWMVAVGRRDVAAVHDLFDALMVFYTMRPRWQESAQMLQGSLAYWAQQPDHSAEETVLLALLRVMLARVQMLLQQGEAAQESLAAAAVLTPEVDAPSLAHALIVLGWVDIWSNRRLDRARAWLHRAISLLEPAGDRWSLSYAYRTLGDVAHVETDYAESQRLYDLSLEIARANADPWNTSVALQSRAEVAYTMGDYPAAVAFNAEALRLAEEVGAQHEQAWALERMAALAFILGRYAESRAYFLRVQPLAQRLGDYGMLGDVLHGLGELATAERDFEEAARHFERGRAIWALSPSRLGLHWLQTGESWMHIQRGDLAAAERLAQAALEGFTAAPHAWGVSAAQFLLGEVARQRGDLARARGLLLESIREAAGCKSIMLIMRHLGSLAQVLAASGEAAQGLTLLALVERHPATWHFARVMAAERFADLAAELPPSVALEARQQAETLSAEAAVNALLAALPLPEGALPAAPPAPAADALLLDPLTEREIEVLRLINAGLTNPEIADRMVVSVSTVKKHINHLFSKLDVTNRTQAIVRGRALGLLR